MRRLEGSHEMSRSVPHASLAPGSASQPASGNPALSERVYQHSAPENDDVVVSHPHHAPGSVPQPIPVNKYKFYAKVVLKSLILATIKDEHSVQSLSELLNNSQDEHQHHKWRMIQKTLGARPNEGRCKSFLITTILVRV